MPKLPSAFSKSMGLILCGIVDEPISPATFFCLKYPKEIYIHMSLLKSIIIELVKVNARLSSATPSWGSIYVVYGFHVIPRPSTKLWDISSHSNSGKAVLCAFKLPVAPLNLPRISIASIFLIYLLSLYAKLASSLPTVLGVALYPWVLHIIGMSAYSIAISSSLYCIPFSFGSITFCME